MNSQSGLTRAIITWHVARGIGQRITVLFNIWFYRISIRKHGALFLNPFASWLCPQTKNSTSCANLLTSSRKSVSPGSNRKNNVFLCPRPWLLVVGGSVGLAFATPFSALFNWILFAHYHNLKQPLRSKTPKTSSSLLPHRKVLHARGERFAQTVAATHTVCRTTLLTRWSTIQPQHTTQLTTRTDLIEDQWSSVVSSVQTNTNSVI